MAKLWFKVFKIQDCLDTVISYIKKYNSCGWINKEGAGVRRSYILQRNSLVLIRSRKRWWDRGQSYDSRCSRLFVHSYKIRLFKVIYIFWGIWFWKGGVASNPIILVRTYPVVWNTQVWAKIWSIQLNPFGRLSITLLVRKRGDCSNNISWNWQRPRRKTQVPAKIPVCQNSFSSVQQSATAAAAQFITECRVCLWHLLSSLDSRRNTEISRMTHSKGLPPGCTMIFKPD